MVPSDGCRAPAGWLQDGSPLDDLLRGGSVLADSPPDDSVLDDLLRDDLVPADYFVAADSVRNDCSVPRKVDGLLVPMAALADQPDSSGSRAQVARSD